MGNRYKSKNFDLNLAIRSIYIFIFIFFSYQFFEKKYACPKLPLILGNLGHSLFFHKNQVCLLLFQFVTVLLLRRKKHQRLVYFKQNFILFYYK